MHIAAVLGYNKLFCDVFERLLEEESDDGGGELI